MMSCHSQWEWNYLKKLSNKFQERLIKIEKEIYKITGKEFNIGSPKQLGEIIYNELKIAKLKKTKKGSLATSAKILEDLALTGHKFPNLVLEWRQVSKLKSTYTDALQEHINKKTKRVFNFLVKNGFKVIEVPNKKYISLKNNVKIKIVKFGYIDSALIIEGSEEKILNLNDCPLNDIDEIKKFKKEHGRFDLLLTQFSYAAWKGNKDNKKYRQNAALDKLETLTNQFNILECKKVIPFASFIYFSNKLNHFMNDEINKPHLFQEKLKSKIDSIILAPGEEQNISELAQKQESLDFWKHKYETIDKLPLDTFDNSIDFVTLKSEYTKYKNRILEINSKLLIYLSSKIKFLKFFQPINIFLLDYKKYYEFSLIDGFKETNNTNSDITMHSESLLFIFKNDFGYDTLTVNGCFNASKEGFIKTTRSFAIGSLNSMGLKLNLGLILNYNLIFFFIKLLRKVSKKL